MKIKDLFINGKLIEYINNISPLNADWLNSTTENIINVQELDNYIFMCIGDSNILKSVEEHTLNNIRIMLNANAYRLNTLWKTANFEYNPIDNYDRTETQTHNEKIDTGNHTTTTTIGARTQTNTNGGYTDTNTVENKTTAFDTTDYDKGTDKNTNSFVKGSSTDSINSSSATDSVVQNGYTDNSSGGYTLRARGNIGTMSTQNMIEQERQVSNFMFMDKIIELFEKYITCMCYE